MRENRSGEKRKGKAGPTCVGRLLPTRREATLPCRGVKVKVGGVPGDDKSRTSAAEDADSESPNEVIPNAAL